MRALRWVTLGLVVAAVACGTVWGFEDPLPLESASSGGEAGVEGGVVAVDTPVAPGDPTRACVPRPPPDWDGPLILFEGAGVPPVCLDNFRAAPAYDGKGDLKAPPAMCNCACGAVTNAGCAASAVFFGTKDCTGQAAGPAIPLAQQDSGACTAWPANGDSMQITAAPTGTCTPTLESASLPDAGFATTARACAPLTLTQAGCPEDRVATPMPTAPFGVMTYCAQRPGAQDCPATFPAKRTFYVGVADKRGCECACSAPKGGRCGGVVTGYDNAGTCKGGDKAIPSEGCAATPKLGGAFRPDAGFDPGICAPEPHPTGAATPLLPTTICCTR